MAHVRLQAVERQDDRWLLDQPLAEPGPIREPHGDQFLVAVHQVGDRPLADCQPTGHEFPMDLRDTAMVRIATGADEGNHIEPKLGVWQNERAFRLRPVGPAIPLTSAVGTGPDLQGAGNESGEGGDGAVVRVGNPEGTTTDPAVVTAGCQVTLLGRFRAGTSAGHQLPPSGLVSPLLPALPTLPPRQRSTNH